MSGSTASDGMLYATYRFTFDHVYDQDSSQEDVYNQSARQLVHSTLQGYNAAIIAYGQTGTGKTYTMEGAARVREDEGVAGDLEGPLRGIIPRSIEDIFCQIQNDPEPSSRYLVRLSYLQIYNEVISDLLKPDRTNLVIREDRRRGVFVDGLSEWVVRSPREVYELMMRGAEQRATGATKMNEVSSRSHAVCIIIVEKCSGTDTEASSPDALMGRPPAWAAGRGGSSSALSTQQSIRVGKLNLVDLAGSERVHITGATGKRLEESKKINASLSALGNVIAALTDRKDRQHIPYRDSKLTRILEDSLGGNCKTTMMCMVSPALEAFAESLSTLKFANRAKNIKNQAVVNEDLDQRTLLRKYERELRKLRAELQRRSKELVDKRRLLEVEEQKRQAENEKLEVLKVLEARSREFMREKEEKRQLEAKIASMQGQLLIGGTKPEDSPTFRTLLAKEHKRIRGEYESRLRELEAERQLFEEDLAQVDRYKQLLLKQRDIMIALTARLNERDEQIMTLQEELEAYDKHQRLLEDQLDGKTAELIGLRRAALEAEAMRTRSGTLLGTDASSSQVR
ncbi:Osmotic avoidance abnormal protein 3 [Monoraphidium neglectum]|uniref:Kinesin-like protein n=1 Tax=Monoraphidium neglectum TaxID=145388 RepID=A0A0D2NUB3_9CHLO|nr:Osmotic avoidance abnormal protein 3 [Monoraphidium neglectum]KIZ07666.1 Osmotic avoidance abnormal protein 3 [Monoraphidium neglectum]|eukprot:XP_013906685.1 Osmotic avoidance abnormal protein 3 [Monoraphidium neglectum]